MLVCLSITIDAALMFVKKCKVIDVVTKHRVNKSKLNESVPLTRGTTRLQRNFSFAMVLLFLAAVTVGLHTYNKSVAVANSDELRFFGASSSLLTGAVVGLESSHIPIVAQSAECWRYTSLATCPNMSGCLWNSQGSFCERMECWRGQRTNQTYCQQTLNTTFNISCSWANNSGQEACFPISGSFFGKGCSDFNGNQNGCRDSNFCSWNASGSKCQEPLGGMGGGGSMVLNPSCSVISAQDVCVNISGCGWGSGACSGNAAGLSCQKLNQSICTSFSMLSSCCSWNGTSCSTSYEQSCKNNKQPFPTGASFCEDKNSFKNQSVCEQVSGSPWYMPCKWDNRTSECHFNTQGFGSSSSFNEINTQVACEAQGGKWKSEQFSSGGVLRADTWCEFNHGQGGNCDSACWACESAVKSSTNTTLQARGLCQNSSLGYCEFRADANSPNKLGWCNAKQDFVQGGAKSCNDVCSGCDFLVDSRLKCQNSVAQCNFVNDSNAPNGAGYCYGKSEKYCGNDCFSCYDSGSCFTNGKGGNGACNWDSNGAYCKPIGFSGEVCFNAVDDDNDGKTDCADSDCATDKFCGGAQLASKLGNCPSYVANSTCTTAGCNWLRDGFESQFGSNTSGHCDFPGAQCGQMGRNSAACNATAGCSYATSSSPMCMQNDTLFSSCFMSRNQSACAVNSACGWNSGSGGFSGPGGQSGWCEPVLFSQCMSNSSRRTGQSACEANFSIGGQPTQICRWNTQYNPAGDCQPTCFGLSVAGCSNASITRGMCEQISGTCEPTAFSGGCFNGNGNVTKCNGPLNSTCSFFTDSNAANNVSSGIPSGWCQSKSEANFVNQMGNKQPTLLGRDTVNNLIYPHLDILEVGLMDDFDRYLIGMSASNFSLAAVCKDRPVRSGQSGFGGTFAMGQGTRNGTYMWYFDSDGNLTNGCASRDNSSLVGFEFSFKYSQKWGANLQELKSSYQCVNGSWGAVPIPLSASSQLMCGMVGGPVIGIEKTELFKFRNLFNKSKDIRLYVAAGNDSNDSIVSDVAGPFYYSQGSFDFKFEDCENTGGDADGDGLIASTDPDCVNFLKLGYAPNEVGFQCGDTQDNDGDGTTDCADSGCATDSFFCGGTLAVNPNDKTAPKITWFKADTFPDSAFITYDTSEPANGTLEFYLNDSACTSLNTTILDNALFDSNIVDYRIWHDGGIDSFAFNPQRLQYTLTNGSTYYFKTRICDISSNCAVSACLNFTTKTSFASCKSCSSTFTFPFQPPSGVGVTDPLGNLKFTFELPDGSRSDLSGNASTGVQLNYTQSKSFNVIIENPNSTSSQNWRVVLVNATLGSKVSSSAQNFTAGSDIAFNSTSTGKFIGLSSSKCQELINAFRPTKLQIGIPGNVSDLWQCSSNLANCTNKTSSASRLLYNTTLNSTMWMVPSEWGC